MKQIIVEDIISLSCHNQSTRIYKDGFIWIHRVQLLNLESFEEYILEYALLVHSPTLP